MFFTGIVEVHSDLNYLVQLLAWPKQLERGSTGGSRYRKVSDLSKKFSVLKGFMRLSKI